MKNISSNPLALSIAITAALVAPIATAAGHHAGITAASFAPFSADAPALVSVELGSVELGSVETATASNPVKNTAVDSTVAPVLELSNEEQALADRMALALNGHKVSKHVAAKPAAKPTKDAVYVCGQWEELWQGRGTAQTCEWR